MAVPGSVTARVNEAGFFGGAGDNHARVVGAVATVVSLNEEVDLHENEYAEEGRDETPSALF
jgi:hypothetical protein